MRRDSEWHDLENRNGWRVPAASWPSHQGSSQSIQTGPRPSGLLEGTILNHFLPPKQCRHHQVKSQPWNRSLIQQPGRGCGKLMPLLLDFEDSSVSYRDNWEAPNSTSTTWLKGKETQVPHCCLQGPLQHTTALSTQHLLTKLAPIT